MTALGDTIPEDGPVGAAWETTRQRANKFTGLDTPIDILKAMDKLPTTDVGNACRLVLLAQGNFRYCPALGWLVWNEKYWVRDELGTVINYAKMVSVILEYLGKGKGSQSKGKILAMVALAQTEPDVATLISRFDIDPWVLNVRNGTIDLRTGWLRPHCREDLITRMCPVDYQSELGSQGLFRDFMLQLLPPDIAEYLLRVYGYGLTGFATEQFLTILYGEGSNGKSTLEEYVQWLMGDYAIMANEGFLEEQRFKGHPTELARLSGKRLIVAVETGEGRKLNETRVKAITGSDRLTGRFMNKDFFEFDPTWTVTMATNHKPLIRGTDHAIWRRVRLVPFLERFVDCEEDTDKHSHCKDRELSEKLRSDKEASKALNLLIEACKRWQEKSLWAPESVMVATEQYQSEMDDAGRFITECCEQDADAESSETANTLYFAYIAWAESEDQAPMKQTMFGRKLTDKGFDKLRLTSGPRRDQTIRVGLRLKGEWQSIGILKGIAEASLEVNGHSL